MEENIAIHRPVGRMCRERLTSSQRGRQLSWKELFPHARIVNDPTKLAHLKSEVEKRKHGASQPDKQPCERTTICESKTERWMEVCALAAQEQDPKKLTELTNEILRLLDQKKDCPEGTPAF